jgi:hypothetical protein
VGPRRLELGDVTDLAEQEISDLRPLCSRERARLLWREHRERGVRAIVDRRL